MLLNWLVVDLPSEKYESMGRMTSHILWKKEHVPNHQLVNISVCVILHHLLVHGFSGRCQYFRGLDQTKAMPHFCRVHIKSLRIFKKSSEQTTQGDQSTSLYLPGFFSSRFQMGTKSPDSFRYFAEGFSAPGCSHCNIIANGCTLQQSCR